jgi:nucleoside-diphosphate-sugar epimerase
LSLLRSAKQYGKNLKHISVTGSINSITMGDDLATRTLTNSSWIGITQDSARQANHMFVSYCSSKKESELAAWEFMKTEKPTFGLTVFLPALIFGPPIQPVKDSKHLNFSVDVFYSLWDGRNETIPATMFPSYIDVRDLAVAHVRALTEPAANNKRFLIGGMPLTYTAMVRELKSLIESGELPEEVGAKLAKESDADKHTVVPKIEAQEGNEALKMHFRSLRETVRDMAKRILEIKAEE